MPSVRRISKALDQLVDMQQVAYADATNCALAPIARAQAMRAWECLEERKRILRAKPLPGSLRPAEVTPKRFAARKSQHASALEMQALMSQLVEREPPQEPVFATSDAASSVST